MLLYQHRWRRIGSSENAPWFQGVAVATPVLQDVMRRSCSKYLLGLFHGKEIQTNSVFEEAP
jgi:hypothetical protein